MEKQLMLGGSHTKISIQNYKYYPNSVGNNFQSIQITTKYRYHMMRKEKLKVFCKVAIEDACRRHKIEISILKVMEEHVHAIVDCPKNNVCSRINANFQRVIILFRVCPKLRLRYPNGHFWSEGYFCESCGSDFERAYSYNRKSRTTSRFEIS